ncbi:hypothetical protein D3C73_1365600 [compost metagenome]
MQQKSTQRLSLDVTHDVERNLPPLMRIVVDLYQIRKIPSLVAGAMFFSLILQSLQHINFRLYINRIEAHLERIQLTAIRSLHKIYNAVRSLAEQSLDEITSTPPASDY